MATIKSPLGRIKGTIGNLVFRNVKNLNTISSIPASFNTPEDAASQSRRTKFRFVVKLSAAIIKLFSLHFLWTRTVPVGNRCLNKVFMTNYGSVSDTLDISNVMLCENPAVIITNPEINIQSTNVQVVVAPIGPDQMIDAVVEKKIASEGIMFLSTPVDETAPQFAFISFSSADQDLDLTDTLTFNNPLSPANQLLAQRYSVKKTAIVLVTKDSKGDPVKGSETFYS